MKCIHCQQQHASHATYCPTTGKNIDVSVAQKYTYETLDFCVSCGEANKSFSFHCHKCGTSTAKLATKKKSVDQLIDQGLTAIPDIKNSVNFQKGKTSVKEASAEHSNYIKKTPLILLPATISIAVVLLIAALMVGKIKDNMGLIGEFLDLDGLNFLDAQMLSAYLTDELGVIIDVPNFPIFTTLMSLFHNINYSVTMEYTDSGTTEIFKIQESNILFGLLLVPIIALVIGAIVYGYMAKKYNWHFWRGVAYSTALYTVFLVVIALISRFKVKASGRDYYDDLVQIEIAAAPSILNTVITGIIVSAIIFGLVGYISYSGKQLFANLERASKYFKYIMYTFIATAVGLVLHLINAIIAVKKGVDDMTNDFYSMFVFEMIPESAYFIVSLYAAIVNWYLTMFGKVVFKSNEYGSTETFEYRWFFKDSLYESDINEIIDVTTFIPPFLFAIITFAIIGSIGYFLTKQLLIDWKDAAIVAGIFTTFQLIILVFVNVNIEIIDRSDVMKITMGLAILQQVLTTAIFSFVAIMAGSFVKMKLK